MFVLTLCLQLLSMYLLAISKSKHFKQVFKRFPRPSEVIFFRTFAGVFCLFALFLLEELGWAMVALYSLSQIAIAIFTTSLLLREKSK